MPKIGFQICFLGIDPGVNGSLTCISAGGAGTVSISMPEDPKELWEFINLRSEPFGEKTYAVLEQVTGYVPGQKGEDGQDRYKNSQPGSRMFTFGLNYGLAKMALIAARIDFKTIVPRTWQKGLDIEFGKGETYERRKKALAEMAKILYPELKPTRAIADSLLIAGYCKQLVETRQW